MFAVLLILIFCGSLTRYGEVLLEELSIFEFTPVKVVSSQLFSFTTRLKAQHMIIPSNPKRCSVLT